MFGIDSGELLIIALVALVVIGPKDLPRAMRTIGQWVGRARGMASQFRTGFDTMVREAELDDMEKKWKAQNEQIMRDHPNPNPMADGDWGLSAPALPAAGTAEEYALPVETAVAGPTPPQPPAGAAPALSTRRPAPLPPPGLL